MNNMAADEFKGLPMRELIGAPLQAACESQQKLAETALDFMLRIGFDAKNGADCYSKNGDAVTVPTWQS